MAQGFARFLTQKDFSFFFYLYLPVHNFIHLFFGKPLTNPVARVIIIDAQNAFRGVAQLGSEQVKTVDNCFNDAISPKQGADGASLP